MKVMVLSAVCFSSLESSKMAAPMRRINFRRFSRFLQIFEPSIGFSPIYLTNAGTLHNGACTHRFATPQIRLVHLGTRCCSEKSDDGATATSDVELMAKPKKRKTERKKFNELQRSHLPENKKQDFAEDMMNAAEAVGKLTQNPERTMNDLLSKLQSHPSSEASSAEKNVGPQQSLGDLLSSMNLEGVDQPSSAKSSSAMDMEELPKRDEAGAGKIYTGQRLNIFSADIMGQPKKPSLTPLMDKLAQERMELFARLPPANAFEEMIHWTADGKMWKFPIDNEQGLDEEKAVPFTEHVFLEHLIEDFPKKGPIRHFMELVVVGLSKNPYISVQEKHDQIQWFRDYFKDKMHLVELVEEHKQVS